MTKVNGSEPLTIVTRSAILCGSGFLDSPLLLMQKGSLIVSGGTVKEHGEGICLITNIASEFLNYLLAMPFILLHILGSVLIFSCYVFIWEKFTRVPSIHTVTLYAPFPTTLSQQTKVKVE